MPRRFSDKIRIGIYRYLCARDGGEKCYICGKAPDAPYSLDIDHVDNNKGNDDWGNLRLACRRCNVVKENKRRKGHVLLGGVPVRQLARELEVSVTYLYQVSRGETPPSKRILDWMKANNRELKLAKGKREGTHIKSDIGPEEKMRQSATRTVRQVVDFMAPDAPPAMQANFLMELTFVDSLVGIVRQRGLCSKEYALSYGAAAAGCSPETAKRYLSKLTTELGPFQEIKDVLGGWMLTFQEGLS